MLDFISIHADFVASDNGFEAVVLAETLGDIRTKLHTDTTLARAATLLLLGIGPEHLHHQSRLARLLLVVSVELADIVQGNLVVGEQATVENQVLATDKRGERQGRETLREELEDSVAVLEISLWHLMA